MSISPTLPDGEEAVIRIRGLRNAFGAQVVHDRLDLDVKRGEILGVVGGSGTGKSVLMRSIIGLQTPEAGEVEVLGESMVGRDEDEAKNIRRRWGILFQQGALFSTLTVAENVEVPLREYFHLTPKLMDEIASYKIAMAGLPANAGPKYPSELSGGMIKRAGLARALALDPELLFLDEPTASLDPAAVRAFEAALGVFHERGTKIVMATHDLQQARRLAGEVLFLCRGRVLEQSPAAQFFTQPCSLEARAFLQGEIVG
jgi:phospholipid/cholesterol/gamma-HCH transport system ATP-binding protein